MTAESAAKQLRNENGTFKLGHEVPKRAHRPKGSQNKISKDLKAGIVTAAANIGRDGNGAGGLVGYLEDLALNHKKAFSGLLGKVLPLQVHTDLSGSIVTINLIPVASGNYLSDAEITRMREATLIEHDAHPRQSDVAS